jgi:hypothetical protein
MIDISKINITTSLSFLEGETGAQSSIMPFLDGALRHLSYRRSSKTLFK